MTRINGWAASALLLVAGSGVGQSTAPLETDQIRLRSGTFTPQPGVETSFAEHLKDKRGSEISATALAANADTIRSGGIASLAPDSTRLKGWVPHDSRDPGALHGIIQPAQPITLEYKHRLQENGIRLWTRLGGVYAATVKQGTDLNKLQAQGLFRWAGPLPPKAKVETSLTKKEFGAWAREADGRVKLLVRLFPDVGPDLATSIFAAMKVSAIDQHIDNVWAVSVEPSLIEKLAELDVVQNIEQAPAPPSPLDIAVLISTHAIEVQDASATATSIIYKGLAGRLVRVGVADFGIYGMHPELSSGTSSRVKHPKLTSIDTSKQPNVHGTHTAAIIGASGLGTNTPPYSLRGYAPNVQIGDYGQFTTLQSSTSTEFSRAIEIEAMDLTNHSYTQSNFGYYDGTARTLDKEIHGGFSGITSVAVPDRPQVWAVGNNGSTCVEANNCVPFTNRFGYYSVYSSAKNPISVGSIDARTRQPSAFSSLGPTLDGRVKPDLVAPGCIDSRSAHWTLIEAAEPVNAMYGGLCGTSEAAPVVAGTIALMLEKYRLLKGATATLTSAEAKAILIETADTPPEPASDLSVVPSTGKPLSYHGVPNFVTGFGIVNSLNAVTLLGQLDHWASASPAIALAQTGDKRQWCMQVPSGMPLIKVTLAWDDDGGATSDELGSRFAPELVNDLDLTLISPSGSVWLPWHIDRPTILGEENGNPASKPIIYPYDQIDDASIPVATRHEDHINNVEMASVDSKDVTSGTWKVVVSAFDVQSSQQFALAANVPISPCPAR